MKKRILFVCHGNVGRSPSAEYLFKDMVYHAGLANRFEISSAGTAHEAVGIPFDARAKQRLLDHGTKCEEHFARLMTQEDFDENDMIICMDDFNVGEIYRLFGDVSKVSKLLDYTDHAGVEIADPWITKDFDTAWGEIKAGCAGLLEYVKEQL